jgi:glycosyltransferase involved in cell wall biosynthesis
MIVTSPSGNSTGSPMPQAAARPLKVVGIFPAFDPEINELAMVWRDLAARGLVTCRMIGAATDVLKGSNAASLTAEFPNLSIRRFVGDSGDDTASADLIEWAAALQPDVIVCEIESTVVVGRRVQRLAPAPILLHVEHWFESRALPRRYHLGIPMLRDPVQALWRGWFGRQADAVMIANPLERPAIEAGGERYAYAPWPHPPAAGAEPAPRAGRDLDRVIYIGSMSRWKAVETLVANVERLLETVPEATATIVGPPTDATAREALARLDRWGPERLVRLPRLPREAALEAIRGALCVIAPSGSMGWGQVGDAWNAGTPVIGVARFYDLEPERNALVAGDPDAFVARYRQLRADAALWDRLSAEGLRTVREGHSIRVVGDAVMSGLHRTLRLQRTRRA